VTAAASTLGDSYSSLAWSRKLAATSGEDQAARVVAGEDKDLAARDRALAAWARRVVRDPSGTTAEQVDELRAVGYDDKQIFAVTLFVALRIAFSTVNDALGAAPDVELVAMVPSTLRAAISFGRQPVARPSTESSAAKRTRPRPQDVTLSKGQSEIARLGQRPNAECR